jgi:hypothetical protein
MVNLTWRAAFRHYVQQAAENDGGRLSGMTGIEVRRGETGKWVLRLKEDAPTRENLP